MKKLLILAAIFALSLSVCACGGNKGDETTSGSQSNAPDVTTSVQTAEKTQKPNTTTSEKVPSGSSTTKPADTDKPSTGNSTDDESGWGDLIPLE